MIRGVFTANSGIAGERVGDFASRVLLTNPTGSAPLLALSSGMEKVPAKDTTFSWIEDSFVNGSALCAATVNSAATQFTVNDSATWTPSSLLLNVNTGERMIITAIAGNTITVQRRIGTPGIVASITQGDRLHNIGTAFGEGSGKPVAIAQRGESRSNHVQIFKNGWAITGTATAIDYLTGSQLAKNRSQCANYHAEDIEKAFIWGAKAYFHVNNQPTYVSDGVIRQIEAYGGLVETANYGNTAGAMSMKGLMHHMRKLFDNNVKGAPNERISFTSSATLQLINDMIIHDSSIQLDQVAGDTFGMSVYNIKGLTGTLKIMVHPLFSALGLNDLVNLHPQFIRKRELRPTEVHEYLRSKETTNGIDADEGYLLSHLGFEVGAANCMSILRGVNTAVPSN